MVAEPFSGTTSWVLLSFSPLLEDVLAKRKTSVKISSPPLLTVSCTFWVSLALWLPGKESDAEATLKMGCWVMEMLPLLSTFTSK